MGILFLDFSQDDNLLYSADLAGGVSVWTPKTLQQLYRLNVGLGATSFTRLKNNGELLYLSSDGIRKQSPFESSIVVPQSDADPIVAFGFSEPNMLVTATRSGAVARYAAEPTALPITCRSVKSLAISPDGHSIALICLTNIGVSGIHSPAQFQLQLWDAEGTHLSWQQEFNSTELELEVGFTRGTEHFVYVGRPHAFARENPAQSEQLLETGSISTPLFNRSDFQTFQSGAKDIIAAGVERMYNRTSGEPISAKGSPRNFLQSVFGPQFSIAYQARGSEIAVYDIANGKPMPAWGKALPAMERVSITDDARRMVTNTGSALRIWDLNTGREKHRLLARSRFQEQGINGDDLLLHELRYDSVTDYIDVIDLASGILKKSYKLERSAGSFAFSMSPSGTTFATTPVFADQHNTSRISVYNTYSGTPALDPVDFPHGDIKTIAISDGGADIVVQAQDRLDDKYLTTNWIWSTSHPTFTQVESALDAPLYTKWLFSPIDKYLVAIGPGGRIGVFDLIARKMLLEKTIKVKPALLDELALTFSKKSDMVAVAYGANGYLLQIPSLAEKGHWTQGTPIKTIQFLNVNSMILSGGLDGSVRAFDMTTSPMEEKVGIVALDEERPSEAAIGAYGRDRPPLEASGRSRWIVFDPFGRFDTANFDDSSDLAWVSKRQPNEPIAFEAFTKSHFYPGLLNKILSRASTGMPTDIPTDGDVDTPITLSASTPTNRPKHSDTVSIHLSVPTPMDGTDGIPSARKTEVLLSRDGQLVRDIFLEKDVSRDTDGCLLNPGSHRVDIDCQNINLRSQPFAQSLLLGSSEYPTRENDRTVFSAYTFGLNEIKSKTVFTEVVRDASALQRLPNTAYIVSIGVNANVNCYLDLHFAGRDATQFAETLGREVRATNAYRNVVNVELLSDHRLNKNSDEPCENKHRLPEDAITRQDATMANIKSVLGALGGSGTTNPLTGVVCTAPKPISCRRALKKATPDDLLVVFFAGHGFKTNDEDFYLVPYDLPPMDVFEDDQGNYSSEALRHSLSSKELASLFRPIDAGNIALIIDACHSAASVTAGAFKPLPSTSRGLGELAFEKGMRVLVAADSDGEAVEQEGLGHGRLTYSLLIHGLEGRGDLSPRREGVISLSGLLEFAANDVPELFNDARPTRTPQYPTYFDFSNPDRDAILSVSKSTRGVTKYEDVMPGMNVDSVLAALRKCCSLTHLDNHWYVRTLDGQDVGELNVRDNVIAGVRRLSYWAKPSGSQVVSLILSDAKKYCGLDPRKGVPQIDSGFFLPSGTLGQGDARRDTGVVALKCGRHELSISSSVDDQVDLESWDGVRP